jgi:hypothetical protein
MMADEEGWVYVLTNEAMPGIVKIRYTLREPSVRAEELYKDSKNGAVTGVPLPFDVAYKAWVLNPFQVEQAVHKSLAQKRINDNREFFKCSTEEAVEHIRQVAQAKFEESKEEADRKLQLQKEQKEREEAEKRRLALEERRAAIAKFRATENSSHGNSRVSPLLQKKEPTTFAKIKDVLHWALVYLTILVVIVGICFQIFVVASGLFRLFSW